MNYGTQHYRSISTDLLLQITEDLLCDNFLKYHNEQTGMDLELHLRCIVAALRLLVYHGMYPRSGSISHEILKKLCNSISTWKDQLRAAVTEKTLAENMNTDFLLVYARDLIVSLPSDHSLITNVLMRFLAAGTALGHAVSARIFSFSFYL
jgi:hypothetical protein